MSLGTDGAVRLTISGVEILSLERPDVRLQRQVRDLILKLDPPWTKRIQYGRAEAVRFMPPDAVQTFDEAGLLSDWSDELVGWWDDLALSVRSRRADANLKIGRRAEKLSLLYERDRTGRDPKWQAIESSFSGFDILSIVSADLPEPLKVEVKGSMLPVREAHFFVTRHEWEVATVQGTYCFHIWPLSRNPTSPIVISSEHMARHIAMDQGEGMWDQVKIPFSAFTPQAP
ncbi:MAG TPA: DUF3883 domain-containing protein [Stellaceae bacterium]|nr:DUF3883 domain-containing protein [Stellaceae bacterium]